MLKTVIILPRQARDKTQGKLRHKGVLCRLPPTVDATRAGAALASVLQEDPPTVRVSAYGGNFGLGLEWV